jgi:trimeric autotransporter adhesin
VMRFTNPPALTSALNFDRIYVERGGKVYGGNVNKLGVTNVARLNTTASNALLAQLSLPAVNPEVPLALTTASYQGTWDSRDAAGAPGGDTINVAANGTTTCTDLATNAAVTCTLSITNPATGAYSGTVDGNPVAGTLNFITGLGTGTYGLPAPGGNTVTVRR